MRREIEIYELIERYLNNELSGPELDAFTSRVQNDEAFLQEVENQKQIRNFIHDASALDIKESLQAIHQKHTGNIAPDSGNNWLWSIPVILVLSLVVILFWPKSHEENNNLKPTQSESTVKKETTVEILVTETQDSASGIQVENKKISKPKDKYTTHPETENPSDSMEPMESDSDKQQEEDDNHPAALSNPGPIPIDQGSKDSVLTPIEEKPEAINNASEPKLPDCSTIFIEASVEADKSCMEKPTGSIYIVDNSITGGNPPYTVSIQNKDDFSEKLKFENLASNYYSVYIKDKNNCISHLGIFYIEETDCSYEVVFAPDKNEVWEIPVQEQNARLKIFNKAGLTLYEQQLEAGIHHEWNGRTDNGSELPMGAYIFVIEVNDQEPFWGSVTLVR